MSAENLAAAARPPFVLRGRLLTPLGAGGALFDDDAVVAVDRNGRLSFVGAAAARPDLASAALDVRPLLLMHGLVDLHAHLPQLPNAGLGAGLDLLSWLQRYIFPLERSFFRQMRVGAQSQSTWRVMGGDDRPALDPLGWQRLGTLEGTRALGLDALTGSLDGPVGAIA